MENDSINKLIFLIKKYFPDIRKTINEIQKYCINGVLSIPDLSNVDSFVKKIINLTINDKMFDLRKIIIQNEHDFKGDYYVLMKNIFDQICDIKMQEINEMNKKLILMEIGEYMYRSSFVADQEINFYCLLLNINKIIKN